MNPPETEDLNIVATLRIPIVPCLGTLAAFVACICLLTTGSAKASGGWIDSEQLMDGSSAIDVVDADIAIGSGGSIAATWTDSRGILWVSRRAPGEEWTDPSALWGSTAQGARDPAIAVDGNGQVFIAYEYDSDSSGLFRIRRAVYNGSSWNDEVISRASYDAFDPEVAVDSNGNATLVYYEYNSSSDAIIHWANYSDGSWDGPTQLSSSGYDSYRPTVAMNASGRTAIAWQQRIASGGDSYIHIATRDLTDSSFSNETVSNAESESPSVAVGGDGSIAAAFTTLDDNGTSRSSDDYDRVYSVHRDADEDTFYSPTTQRSDSAMETSGPSVDVNADGDIAIAWHQYDTNRITSRSVGVSLLESGASSWTDMTPLSASSSDGNTAVSIDDQAAITVLDADDGCAHRPASGSWDTDTCDVDSFATTLAASADSTGNVIWMSDAGVFAAYDGAGPILQTVDWPENSYSWSAGDSTDFSAEAVDVLSPMASIGWDLGDDTAYVSPSFGDSHSFESNISHEYAETGTYTTAVTARDDFSNESEQPHELTLRSISFTSPGEFGVVGSGSGGDTSGGDTSGESGDGTTVDSPTNDAGSVSTETAGGDSSSSSSASSGSTSTTTSTSSAGTTKKKARFQIVTRKLRADRKGRVKIKIRCIASGTSVCKGRLKMRAKGRTFGSPKLRISAGKTKTITWKLKKTNLRLLKQKRKLRAAVTVSETGAGATTSSKRTVKLLYVAR